MLHADLKPDNFLIDELPPLQFKSVAELLPGNGGVAVRRLYCYACYCRDAESASDTDRLGPRC